MLYCQQCVIDSGGPAIRTVDGLLWRVSGGGHQRGGNKGAAMTKRAKRGVSVVLSGIGFGGKARGKLDESCGCGRAAELAETGLRLGGSDPAWRFPV